MIDRVIKWRIFLEILIMLLILCFAFLKFNDFLTNFFMRDLSGINEVLKFWICPFLIILSVFIIVSLSYKEFDSLGRVIRKEFFIILCCGLVFKFLDYIVYNSGLGIPYRDNNYTSSSANIAFFWRYVWVLAYYGYLLSLWGKLYKYIRSLKTDVFFKGFCLAILDLALLAFLFIAIFLSTAK